AEKKDVAMAFLENELATVDAIAAREIVNPEPFRSGISKIIDGTVTCLHASTWAKGGGYITKFQRSFELDQSQNPQPKIANSVILGWSTPENLSGFSRFLRSRFRGFFSLVP